MTVTIASALAETTPSLESWHPDDIAAGLPYVELGDLASTVAALDASGLHDWSALFAEVERRLASDPGQRDLLVLGFLEGLQNVELHAGRELSRWERVLGPQTLSAWREVIELWSGGSRRTT